MLLRFGNYVIDESVFNIQTASMVIVYPSSEGMMLIFGFIETHSRMHSYCSKYALFDPSVIKPIIRLCTSSNSSTASQTIHAQRLSNNAEILPRTL